MSKSNKLWALSILFLIVAVAQADEVYCDCGDNCSACGTATPAYMKATLVNLQGCPLSFHNQAATAYPCFGGSMDIILKQDSSYPCQYYYYGPTFEVDGSPYDHRLGFHLDFNNGSGETEFWIAVQQNCGGWFDLCWSVVSAENNCQRNGSAEFDSLCNVPSPDIEDGFVYWTQAIEDDGNYPGCEPNDINDTCDDLSCSSLDGYTFIQGSPAAYSGPMVIYSSSQCQDTAAAGNKIRTAKIFCSGADFVSATAVSSAPADITVTALQSSCQAGDSAGFIIDAKRGSGTVTLTATFYKKAYAGKPSQFF